MVPEATIVIKLSHLYNYWARKSKTHLKLKHQLKCLNANKGIVFYASYRNKDTIFGVFFQFSNVHSKMPLDLRVQMFKCQRANTTKGLLTLQSCFTPPLNVSVSKSDIFHLLPFFLFSSTRPSHQYIFQFKSLKNSSRLKTSPRNWLTTVSALKTMTLEWK